jgi:hypothetical protein
MSLVSVVKSKRRKAEVRQKTTLLLPSFVGSLYSSGVRKTYVLF